MDLTNRGKGNGLDHFSDRNWNIANERALRVMGRALLSDYHEMEKTFDRQKITSQSLRRKIPKKRCKMSNTGKQHTKSTFKWSTVGGLLFSVGVMVLTGEASWAEVLRGIGVGLTSGGLDGAVQYVSKGE